MTRKVFENLSKNIYNSSIGEMIKDYYGSLNLVIGSNDEEFNLAKITAEAFALLQEKPHDSEVPFA